MAEPIDIQIAGYEMKREIGSGGMARVFLATQISLGREVAIKVLRKDLAVSGGEDFQRRFLHEGQMLAKLVHPNIVAIYDINQTEEVSYMAMEYLKGGTLSEQIKEGLSVAEVIRITTQVAHALALAHENHIVHRDLKPSNIMFRDDITPVLTDFGIARKTDTEHRLTKTGMVVGTPYYMSPEQITGKDIDGRSDVYSLGIMFYELLAGELPFRAEEPLALAMQHVQEPPPQLPDNVSELQPIMDALLAKNADDRFDSMLDFCQSIKELVMEEPALQSKLSGETKLFNSDQFSDPRFGTGGVRVPERVSRSISTRTGSGRQARTGGGATAVMSSGQRAAVSKGGLGWKLPAAIVMLLIVGSISAYFAFFSTPDLGLSEQDQRVVENLLGRANTFIQQGQYEQPPNANAVDMLKQIFSIAPDHPGGREIAETLAAIYEADASIAERTGNIDEALHKIEVGLSVAPEYAGLVDLKTRIDERILAEQRAEQIEAALASAVAQENAGKFIDPETDNAYATYQSVLKLDNGNAQARAGLDRIQTWLTSQIQAALDDNQLDQAGTLLTRAESLFPDAGAVAQARRDLGAAQQFRRETAEITRLLASAEEQVAAERFVYPPGDNALESYQQVLSYRPSNEDARRGLQSIADHFEGLAQQSFAQGDFAASAEWASRGLRAMPDSERLLAVQRQATGRLDDRARQIERDLQTAERLVQEGQFLSGDQGGALASYQRVLDQSPGNQRAREAIERLPDQIYSAAVQMRRDSSYGLAERLLDEAIAQYPEQPRFAQLGEEVAQLRSQQLEQQRLAQMLSDAQRLVAVRPVTRSSFDQAATALKEILSEFPGELQARSLLGQLTTALATEAVRISQNGNHDAAFRLIDHGLQQFDNNPYLADARVTVQAQQQKEIEEEAARIAALQGVIAIDASPWGEVVEVRNASGELAELPPDATTPLVMTLMEGDYQVTIRGSDNTSRELNVRVKRQDRTAARADFDAMSADQYFQTSGW